MPISCISVTVIGSGNRYLLTTWKERLGGSLEDCRGDFLGFLVRDYLNGIGDIKWLNIEILTCKHFFVCLKHKISSSNMVGSWLP